MLMPPLPWDRPHWRNCGGPAVVLLHGLWRGWHAMEPLARALNRQGFSTLNLPYPSTRLPIPELVGHVRAGVEKIAGDVPVHFVTHSLGGIIARALLAESPLGNPGDWSCWPRRTAAARSSIGPQPATQ
jgi:triacylglycerol lipase